ncbi:hypothetical protein [Serratia sp. Se-RSBMAAmG]|uniref:hypothetical protein n=1 Tax=Serratia sp. Se-RSBMAAmG TaxID=3043305 RepID=UPI0024AF151F|nr:hypothetical protein [Serratia sp. Se-RSBMAAmG]MDI6976241.1 hypothetical protein [Serratia sp. Se-RSBMAAmG]
MSQLTFAVRFSDNTITTFKIHKTFELSELNNILFIHDEPLLKEYLKEHDWPISISASSVDEHLYYDNHKALFAPYGYGIIFIDYITKTIYNHNDYSGFFYFMSLEVAMQIGKTLNFNGYKEVNQIQPDLSEVFIESYSDFKMKASQYQKEGRLSLNVINPFYDNSHNYGSLYNIYQAYLLGYGITRYNLAGNKISTINIDSPESLFKAVIGENEKMDSFISFDIPEWTIFNEASNTAKNMLKRIEDTISLSDEERKLWKNFINQ